jgi:N-acetylglutamate synthase-like GNAT family acetyltransferase
MNQMSVRPCGGPDFDAIWTIINDGARAYQGQVPADCLRDPYMSREELEHEIAAGVKFWGYEENGALQGVMGIQDVKDVTLIRHAYVRAGQQNKGIGGRLLQHLLTTTERPVLIGTWAAATWAIRFYERHGFEVTSADEKNRLLKKYWNIPERQVETSVVLVQKARRGGTEARPSV